MPISSRKFWLLVSGLALGLVISLAYVGSIARSYYSTNYARAYYQIIGPRQYISGTYTAPISGAYASEKMTVHQWAWINHTLVILDSKTVVSILTIKPAEIPFMKNITFTTSFNDPSTYGSDDPAPTVLKGNLSWTGVFDRDLHMNETVVIWNRLRFDFDATFYIGGWVFTYASQGSNQGYGTFFYITLKDGEIINIVDRARRTPNSAFMEAEKLPT